MVMGAAAGPGGGGRDTVMALIGQIGPAFELGRDLMTEGHAAAEKIVGRASRHFEAGEYRQSASLLTLAARLLGVEPSASDTAETPDWFTALAQPPSSTDTKTDAEAAVDICEAMAASEPPAKPVMTLIQKARQELDAGRVDEAGWWASVAMAALGLTHDTLAATDETPEAETPE
jgi:hypothetical protein